MTRTGWIGICLEPIIGAGYSPAASKMRANRTSNSESTVISNCVFNYPKLDSAAWANGRVSRVFTSISMYGKDVHFQLGGKVNVQQPKKTLQQA